MNQKIAHSLILVTLGFLVSSARAEMFEASASPSPAPAPAPAASPAKPAAKSEGGSAKQPVFLICPKHNGYSAWSLFLNVDRNNPEKVLSLGLEELQNKNAQDMTYDDVLAAQNDARTHRKALGTLDAAQFGKGTINVTESDALHVSVANAGADTLRLTLSMRVSFDGRFTIGGKDQKSRDVLFKYDAGAKTWSACADHLKDETSGAETATSGCLPLTGVVFPVTGTGIYRVVAATNSGDAVVVMDRE